MAVLSLISPISFFDILLMFLGSQSGRVVVAGSFRHGRPGGPWGGECCLVPTGGSPALRSVPFPEAHVRMLRLVAEVYSPPGFVACLRLGPVRPSVGLRGHCSLG